MGGGAGREVTQSHSFQAVYICCRPGLLVRMKVLVDTLTLSAAFGSREKVLPVFIKGNTSWPAKISFQEGHGRDTWGKA